MILTNEACGNCKMFNRYAWCEGRKGIGCRRFASKTGFSYRIDFPASVYRLNQESVLEYLLALQNMCSKHAVGVDSVHVEVPDFNERKA